MPYRYFSAKEHKVYQPLFVFRDIGNILIQKGYCWVLAKDCPSDCTNQVKNFVPKAPDLRALPKDMQVGAQEIASSETEGR